MNKVSLVAIPFLALFLTACGGGSGSDSSSSSNTDNGSGTNNGSDTGNTAATNGVSPVTPLTTSSSQNIPIGNVTQTITYESGYEGDIVATSQASDDSTMITESIYLAAGIPSLNVSDVQREESINFSCDSGENAKGTITTDFSSGVNVISGTSNGRTLSCTSTYASPLPLTITDTNSIKKLLEEYADDYDTDNASETGLISTNCPQDDDSDDDFDVNITLKVCTGSFLTNYTVTDDTGKVHKISQRYSF